MAELNLHALVASVLVSRGLTEPEDVHHFLNPSLDDLNDPSLLPDFDAASKAILGARERKDLIYIHGDYDVDGVTSAALLTRFLRSIDCNVVTHVPHRMKEGYGIHFSAVDAAKELGAKLFLTCDCGIGAFKQIDQAREYGMTVVVTDHHTVSTELPRAHAIVNPHRHDSKYPYPELSGVGVAFKLCEGITRELGLNKLHFCRAFLDLAALGTIADVMPLEGENRIIARFGLQRLAETKKIGLKALIREAEIELKPGESLRGYHVGFVLGPRLNAAGRIDDAALALQLLLESDEAKARALASEVEQINRDRKAEQLRIMDEAVERVLEIGANERNVIVVAKEGWHSGVIGIVAGRLVEMFRRPTFVLTMDEETGVCKGSARSIPNFHLADAIRAHPDLFLSGGGHAMAAGCTFEIGRLDEVADALHDYAGGLLTPEDFLPTMIADAELRPDEITRDAVEALSAMEPFGCGNPEPVFCVRGMELAQLTPTRNPQHVRLNLKSTAGLVTAMGFSMGERLAEEEIGTVLDVLFKPCIDEYRGTKTLKWHLRDYVVQ
jgi:single-stranded-DNA-specific exonuclease